MKHTICNQVRLEIDEKELNASLSAGAMDHLRHCNECQEFQSKETKLRQIIGDLETVNAPADFDFRLRARLASERTGSSYLSMSPVRVWRMRSAAVAAMLVLFAATIYMIRQNQPVQPTQSNQTTSARNETQPAKPSESPTTPPEAVVAKAGTESASTVKKSIPRRQFIAEGKRPTATVDSSNTVAPVVSINETFPLDVSQPSFKVSLDDGRGTSRTISVPTVSFGSRRVLTPTMASNQLGSKGDW